AWVRTVFEAPPRSRFTPARPFTFRRGVAPARQSLARSASPGRARGRALLRRRLVEHLVADGLVLLDNRVQAAAADRDRDVAGDPHAHVGRNQSAGRRVEAQRALVVLGLELALGHLERERAALGLGRPGVLGLGRERDLLDRLAVDRLLALELVVLLGVEGAERPEVEVGLALPLLERLL